MENQGVDSPIDHIDNDLEKNNTPEAQQTDTPKTKTKKSKWESESDIEPESEPRFSKKRRGKKHQKSVDSEVDEQSQPEISESVKRLKSSNEDSFNQSPSIQSVS